MKYILWSFIFISVTTFLDTKKTRDAPLFFEMGEIYKNVQSKEQAFSFEGQDSSLEHQVWMLLDKEKRPLLFYADIVTPVCIDGVCKPMYIEIYWNLVGEYVGYGIHQEYLLRKFDHGLFEAADYEKLHQLLLNKHSILERKKLSDLFDANAKPKERIQFKGQDVDAVSGATKKEIKESVIEGALYSCYTIWHLVHGLVEDKIKNQLQAMYSPILEANLLYSEYPSYQFYALRQLDTQSFEHNIDRVIQLFSNSKPLIRTYILKKIPEPLWANREVSDQIYGSFQDVDINSRTLLIEKLEQAHPIIISHLANHLTVMTKNQLKAYLAFLKKQPDRLTLQLFDKLKEVSRSQGYRYSYLVEDFIEGK